MPELELFKDGERQMRVCNACRYCEGYCAVFPAMELRRSFAKGDLAYLANLCFDCRDCYYACQYAPPHEFAVNIPKLMAELRADTYREFGWPAMLTGAFQRSGLTVALTTIGALVVLLLSVLTFVGSEAFLAAHLGEGAFYRVVPYAAMTLPFLAMALYALAVLVAGAIRFWRASGGAVSEASDPAALWQATRDAFGLTYMKGGGANCNYPDESFSQSRRWLHHLVFYGFLLDFASTNVAAFYDHFLGWQAPYPLGSWPVVLGTLGGIGLLVGTGGLFVLKAKSDPDPAAVAMRNMDVAFLASLFLTSLTGLLLLLLRETAAMGTLLGVHLATVAGLFLTAPYGKFVHLVYRCAALVRHAVEQRAVRSAPPG